MEQFTVFLNWLDGVLWGIPFIAFVMVVGLYFTLRSGLFSIRYFSHIMKHTFGSIIGKEANKSSAGHVSPFEAACIAIGGSVGTANISGVATAIAVGGPGSVFWLWIWAFFGMFIKLVETTLGVYYRSKDEDGNYYGGSMYFMEKGIGREMGKKAGFFLASAFALFFVIQFVQGSQAYTIAEVLNASFGFDMMLVTVVYTVFVYNIIWKGTPTIAKFASKFVPFMCVIYLLGGIAIIVANFSNVPSAIATIFSEAFTGSAAVGGFAGAAVTQAMRSGISRSMNSNEAGLGSSPLVHGSADTIHPVRQGLWGSFEAFIDTLVVCSITALAVICSGAYHSGASGATLTIQAFTSVFGGFGSAFIGIMTVLFGATTTAGWFIYYRTTLLYLFRKNAVVRDKVAKIFKIIFPLTNIIIVSYIVFSGNGPDLFWTIISILTAPSVFINLIALFVMRNKFFTIFKDYKARYMGIGEVDKDFHVFYEDDPKVFAEEEAIREDLRKQLQEVHSH